MTRLTIADAAGGSSSASNLTGAAAFKATLEAFRASFTPMIVAALDSTIMELDPQSKRAELLQRTLKPLFEDITRKGLALAEELSDADVESNRKALKAQEMTNKMKIEAQRTAASVNLQNQAAEMEATFNTALATKLDALTSGGTTALREAQEKAEELQKELDAAQKQLFRSEEMLKSLRAIIRSKEEEEKTHAEEVERLNTIVDEQVAAEAVRSKGSKEEIKSLRAAMEEAAAEADRASLQSDKECKRLVAVMAQRLKDAYAAVRRGNREDEEMQLARLLSELGTMSRSLADAESLLDHQKNKAKDEVAAANMEKKLMKAKLDELESQRNSEGSFDVRSSLEAAEKKAKQLATDLDGANKKIIQKAQEVAQKTEEAQALRREMAERTARILAQAQRAALQTADECKRQVEALAGRLKSELDTAKQGEREHAQQQLDRLLGELGDMSHQLGVLELKYREAEESVKKYDDVVERVRVLEAEERVARGAISRAMGDPTGASGENVPLNAILNKLLGHYNQVKMEYQAMRAMLDRALKDVALTVGDNTNLIDKLHQLIDEFARQREESKQLRATLDKALQDIAATVGENANLSDKLRQLLHEYRSISENEGNLRNSLKRQHGALNAAYHRIKEVEVELQRANAAGIEQRESLVNTALSALSQLRLRLGAMHGLKPEAIKPVEDAMTPGAVGVRDASDILSPNPSKPTRSLLQFSLTSP